MVELFANTGGPDQMLHFVVSDLDLHCLPFTLLGVFRLQWVKYLNISQAGQMELVENLPPIYLSFQFLHNHECLLMEKFKIHLHPPVRPN